MVEAGGAWVADGMGEGVLVGVGTGEVGGGGDRGFVSTAIVGEEVQEVMRRIKSGIRERE
jgi:hypothetical protein